MAVYERQTNLPALSNSQVSKFPNSQVPSTRSESLPSISLGTVLIQSMEMMTEAIESDMDRDKLLLTGIEKIIDKQFRKHLKGGLGRNGSSAPSKEYNDYWEQKRQIEWQNHLIMLEKEEKQNREKEIADRQKKTDDVISELSAFAKNPLQGVSNAIDKGVKSIFTGLGSSLGEIGSGVKSRFDKITEPFHIIGNSIVSAKKSVKSSFEKEDAFNGVKNREKAFEENEGEVLKMKSNDSEKSQEKSEKIEEETLEISRQNLEINKEQKKLSDLKLGLVIAGIGAVTLAVPKIMQLAGILIQDIPHFRDKLDILTNVRIPETGEIMLEKGKIILGSAVEDVKNAFARVLQSSDNAAMRKAGQSLEEIPISLGHKKVLKTDTSGMYYDERMLINQKLNERKIESTGNIDSDIILLNESYDNEIKEEEARVQKLEDAYNEIPFWNIIERNKKEIEWTKALREKNINQQKLNKEREAVLGRFTSYEYERLSPAEVGQEIHKKYAAKEGELIQNKIMESAEAGTLSKGELNYWNRNMKNANWARGIDTQTLSPEEFESQIKHVSGFESFQWAPDTRYEFWDQRGKDYGNAWKDMSLNLVADLFTGMPNTGSALTSGM